MKLKKVIMIVLIVILAMALICAVVFVCGVSDRLTVTRYSVETPRVGTPVRLLMLSDLHSCIYGYGQLELMAAIEKEAPDIVVMTGDMSDDGTPDGGLIMLLRALEGKYPCFAVNGNHEHCRKGLAEKLGNIFRSYGITVLCGDSATVEVRGEKLSICGVDDVLIGIRDYREQIFEAGARAECGSFTVLLAHRPELYSLHDSLGRFDLILSGHAHGGQWRLPGIINGLYAPDQGLFPRYTGGVYNDYSAELIVSRGLAKHLSIPRVYNRPEVVVIDIVPSETQ